MKVGVLLHTWQQTTVDGVAPHSFSHEKIRNNRNGKIMATIYWNWKGVLLVDFTPHGTTINTAAYCETLKGLRHPIQNTRRGLLTRSFCLLHNNARAHTARAAQQLLQRFNWEVLDHPAHRSYLLPGDFHLLLHLKKHLPSQKFQEDEKVKHVVATWLHSQAAEFCDFRI
jgi:hypothetical protein